MTAPAELVDLVAAFRCGSTVRAVAARLGIDPSMVEAMLEDATAQGLVAAGTWCQGTRATGSCPQCPSTDSDAACGACPLAAAAPPATHA